MQQEIFYTTNQAAEYLNLSPKTLTNWRWAGYGPVFVKLGNSVRYRKSDLDRFAEACTLASTSAQCEV
jgi:excisionase family DNA binding protein